MNDLSMPPSVNYHILAACNMSCRFCFADFGDVPDSRHRLFGLPGRQAQQLVRSLGKHFEKITFAGGEPTLRTDLPDLLRTAKEVGMVTMAVTNGYRLVHDDAYLKRIAPWLDWVALSVDSRSSSTNRQVGRACGGDTVAPQQLIDLAARLRAAGIRLKMNTVVSAANVGEDLSDLVTALEPERWKLLQVHGVTGQNDVEVRALRIGRCEFDAFVARHRVSCPSDVAIIPERSQDITGSYAMVSPDGCFFDNVTGSHRYSRPILEAGVAAAWGDVAFDGKLFVARGGLYEWRSTAGQPA
jgi:radical S-adenosyl methionine domain-containing protein 2